ncbi:hypothetical protein D6833_13835, partial [Candidatus Parcubacteria bacterium]
MKKVQPVQVKSPQPQQGDKFYAAPTELGCLVGIGIYKHCASLGLQQRPLVEPRGHRPAFPIAQVESFLNFEFLKFVSPACAATAAGRDFEPRIWDFSEESPMCSRTPTR